MMRGVFTPVLIAASLFAVSPAFAEGEPEKLGGFKDWEAYTYKAPDSKVCFAFAEPQTKVPAKVKRDAIRFIVTNYPGRKVKGQISTIIGYPFKEGATVKLSIDDKNFDLFPVGDTAWAGDTDADIVAAMKKGTTLKVEGVSWKGTATTDTYSLTGISAAIDKIDSACK
jgi:Invasion associated locus B (IalB) protein